MYVTSIIVVLFSLMAGISAPCANIDMRILLAAIPWRMSYWHNPGAGRSAFVALLLLTLPVVLTFHVLLALPRFADRRRTFWYSLHPRCNRYSLLGFKRITSLSRHPLIRFLKVTTRFIQYLVRLVCKWNNGCAVSISIVMRLHFSAAMSCKSIRRW